MEIRTILVLLGLLAAGFAAEETWMWTDEEGVVHYSDRPQPGAELVVLDEPNSSQSLSTRPRRNSSNANEREERTSRRTIGPYSR